MAEKSFKKIRCVHATKNSIHFIPEHLITDAYLKENQFIVQEFEEKGQAYIVNGNTPIPQNLEFLDKGEWIAKKSVTEKAVEEKLVKAPKGKLVKK